MKLTKILLYAFSIQALCTYTQNIATPNEDAARKIIIKFLDTQEISWKCLAYKLAHLAELEGLPNVVKDLKELAESNNLGYIVNKLTPYMDTINLIKIIRQEQKKKGLTLEELKARLKKRMTLGTKGCEEKDL